MKRTLLIVGVVMLAVACGRSKEEQMLYDYQQKGTQKLFNMDIEDLDFQIKEVREVERITAADSAKIYRKKLARLWSEDASIEEVDTLSYNHVIGEIDKLTDQLEELIRLNIKIGREYENYKWERQLESYTEARSEASGWYMLDQAYNENPDSVLSVKYQASYSINNPVLNNNKQTFNKYFYSNAENTKLVREEDVSETAPGK